MSESIRPRPRRPPLRILLACDHIDHDGALHGGGRQLVELTRALPSAGAEPVSCVLRPASGLGRRLEEEGLPIRFLGQGSANPAAIARLARIIRSEDIHIVHLTDFGASTYGRIAARLTGRPAVVHIRSHHSEHQPRGFPMPARLAYRLLAGRTARAIAISQSVREFAIAGMGFRPEQVVILNNPLARSSFGSPDPAAVREARAHFGVRPDAPLIGCVTRFHAAKGIRYLVQALPGVLADVPEARLMLVGSGPEEAELRRLAEHLGIADRVVFAGFQRETAPFFATFDVAAVPSIEEGFGNVAVEAMAMGTPVVASRSGGLPEIVDDGVTGHLVPPGEPEPLAAALRAVLRDPEAARRMGEEGRRRSARFSMDRYLDRLMGLYDDVLAGAGRLRAGVPA